MTMTDQGKMEIPEAAKAPQLRGFNGEIDVDDMVDVESYHASAAPSNLEDPTFDDRKGTTVRFEAQRQPSKDLSTDGSEFTNSERVSTTLRKLKQSVLNPYGDYSKKALLEAPADDDSDFEEATEQALSEDIYSLMSIVPTLSYSFAFAIIIFAIQFLTIILVLLDLIDLTSNPRKTNGVINRMGIPADTPITVRAAQVLGVILIVNFGAGEGDLLEGFSHLLNGYNEKIIKDNPHATRIKWYFAGVCQMLVGIFLTVDLFVLMMRSTSNIELCLNFAALHFVQDIDDVAFTMGSMGLITRRVQKDCDHTGEVVVPLTQQYRISWIKRVFLVLLTVLLYVGFGLIASWQQTGYWMCTTLYVQFGDVHGPEWPYYSGLFDTVGHSLSKRIEDRPVYIDTTGTIRLAWCSGEEAWTFSNITETDDHCNYFIKSSTTVTYDIMDVSEKTWYALDVDLGDVPMDWLSMDCNDCNSQICAPDVGTCNANNTRCECTPNRFGINCEFTKEDACDFMALDRRSKAGLSALPFAALFTRKEYRQYEVTNAEGRNIDQMYDRPIYASFKQNILEVFIIYSGYRWIIYGVPQEYTSNTTITDFNSYLKQHNPIINPLETLTKVSSDALPYFEPLFFSNPIKYETESHEVDPINAKWVLAQKDESLPHVGAYADTNHEVSASFICSKCNATTNPCLNGASCDANTTKCNCTNPVTGVQSYGGNLCEYAFSCIEYEAREGALLNGCKCDPVFAICTRCDEGYYGNLCQYQRNVSEVAVEADGSYEETIVLDGHYQCDNATCLNGGYCDNIASPCVCPDPSVHGVSCEKPDCNFFPFCYNNGKCNQTTLTCDCPLGFSGYTCEVEEILPTLPPETNITEFYLNITETNTTNATNATIHYTVTEHLYLDLMDDDSVLDIDAGLQDDDTATD